MDGTGRGSSPQDPAFVTSAEALRVEGLRKSFGAEQAPPGQLFTEPTDERTRRFLRRIVDAGPM